MVPGFHGRTVFQDRILRRRGKLGDPQRHDRTCGRRLPRQDSLHSRRLQRTRRHLLLQDLVLESVPDQLYNVDELHTADSVDGAAWANDQSVTQDTTYQLVSGVSPEWNRGTYGPVDVLYNPSAINPGTDSPFDYTYAMYYDATTGGRR